LDTRCIAAWFKPPKAKPLPVPGQPTLDNDDEEEEDNDEPAAPAAAPADTFVLPPPAQPQPAMSPFGRLLAAFPDLVECVGKTMAIGVDEDVAPEEFRRRFPHLKPIRARPQFYSVLGDPETFYQGLSWHQQSTAMAKKCPNN